MCLWSAPKQVSPIYVTEELTFVGVFFVCVSVGVFACVCLCDVGCQVKTEYLEVSMNHV